MTPDAAIQAKIDDLNAQLLPILGTKVGESNVAVPRSDAVRAETGRTDGRACESLVGDIVTDAMRQQYGTDFAITNSGGLRADLTCPTADSATDFCPSSLYPFARRSLPDHAWPGAGGAAVREPVGDGDDERRHAEGVPRDRRRAAADDRHRPVRPGLRPLLRVQRRGAGETVRRASGTASSVREAASLESCGRQPTARVTSPLGVPVALDAGHSYTVTINDFMMTGGDGYPNVRTSAATQDLLDQDVADYLATLPEARSRRRSSTGSIASTRTRARATTASRARRRRTKLGEPAVSCGGLPLPAPRLQAASCRSRRPPARR